MKKQQEDSLKALELQIELNALYDQLKNSKCIQDDNIRDGILKEIMLKEEYYSRVIKGNNDTNNTDPQTKIKF